MKPVVLLIGRLPNVVADVAQQLGHLPIEWLGAHDKAEVIHQLESEPRISCVVMGAGLDDSVRGALIGVIASRRPDLCIHVKDRASGPEGLLPFAARVVRHELLERATE
ncbi:hypothetical protein SAMN05444007_10887 [Cribrihabitans marinus]|uniref:Uncharacterized protein n=1 Tax=Cribrihabitans marinus TaxID=1227549 RepID=A0A1H7CI36_9RHOB|nr:hypothetical protein [Cribrihabitans marinus]GGH35308.1 hypothetical protein GCM10010973_28570 [Cribrihabitans marinus]SEJ88257.1 hypothetical protein SAMN05444007_10887 [Cribrihabitans marinus]